GDIHGHSVFSDGTGTPEDYYTYGRDAADLDFIALTDHDSWGFRPLSAIEEQYFRAGNSFSDDEHFVVILGYEWTSWDFGHRNVYFSGADACVFDSRNERYDTPDELVSALDAASSIIVPHHLGGGPVPFNLDSWSSKMMPVSEVVSVHGNSESSGCRYRIYNAGEGGFFRDALNRGYMWGAIGSSDSHDGHPGLRTNGAQVRGMVGIWADNLNRTSIFNALRNRFCYATSGARIVVEFYVSGYPMGSVISEVEPKEKVIQGKIIGENDLERIELIKNGTIYNRFYGNGNRCDFHWVDDEGESNRSAYYYLVIYQMDGEFAVSSPIWINVK
ncbi:CehA/McbA family metallohydrolase, partial [bacterium]|nr:CehA/McbA family metallohydrolase [candidate division CSSED10-310 bacterium]